jgi:hypothetical protein
LKGLALFVTFMLGAAALLGGALWVKFGKPADSTAAPAALLAATAAPSETEPPQPTATSTPDATATKQAQDLAVKAWEADIAAKEAQTKRQELDNQERAGQLLALYDWTPTAQAKATEQAEKIAQSTAEAQAAYVEQETARILAAIDADKRKSEMDAIFALIWKSALIIGGVFVVCVVVYHVIRTAQLEQEKRRENLESISDNFTENMTPPPSNFVPVGDNSFHAANPPVSDKRFRMWAEGMLGGETAGINKWETGDRFGSAVSYQPLLGWAEGRGYIEVKSGAKVLSETGTDFCRGWLARHSPTDAGCL